MQPQSQTALENMVRETGVKDAIAQPLIESLTKLSNELMSDQNLSWEQIQENLKKKYNDLSVGGNIRNPFLDMPGTSHNIFT